MKYHISQQGYYEYIERIMHSEIVRAHSYFPEQQLGNPVDVNMVREMTGELFVSLHTHVFAEKLPEKTIETPSTWFQHLKQSIAPKWSLIGIRL